MKKTIITVTLLTVIMVFFCASTFASTGSSVPNNVVTTQYTSNSAIVQVSVASLDPVYDMSEGSNGSYNEGYVDHIVTVRIYNGNSKSVYISNIPINLVFKSVSTPPYAIDPLSIQEVINYSGDFELTYLASGGVSYLYCIPKGVFSFYNNVCIPANVTLSCVTIVRTKAYKGPYEEYGSIDSVAIIGSPSVSTTDFTPLAAHDDLLISLEALRTYLIGSSGIPLVNSNLVTINSSINALKTQIHSDLTTTNSRLSDIWGRLVNIQDILSGDSTTNSNISNDSSGLKTQSDNVHSQEQAYFTQNSQAIQATGLGNYQIGTVEGNGIGAVSSDFTSVWNALNGWNSVYIFSLTLGLALTILRHAPNAISRRQRRKQE